LGRLICVSNRVMKPDDKATRGGLAVALSELFNVRGGLWCGWSGSVAEVPQTHRQDGAYTALTIDMTPEEHEGAYRGYSNSVLWPVFHNRLDLARFDRNFFEAYVAYNIRLADLIAASLRPGDTIWVHDYHFLLLGRLLRERGVTNPIGFFLHIPMPPPEAFLAIPEHRDLASALAAYDLVGLQTTNDVGNFISCVRWAAGAELLPNGKLSIAGKQFQAACFPISIDAGFFAAPPSVPRTTGIQRVIGVDRLDYTKGLPQKFRAFAHLLKAYPNFRKRAVLAQIAAPTRESVEVYSDIRQELEGISGAVNGEYGDVDWMPVHYIHRAVSRQRLAALYRSAAVGLVTPLRDGMNLTAKEYVASQNAADPGVLILSRFAGAAEELRDALLVNPYCVEDIADSLAQALSMPLPERKQRHAALYGVIAKRGSADWAADFIGQLERCARKRTLALAVDPAA
jgi:trehalose 6-phosphate synthase